MSDQHVNGDLGALQTRLGYEFRTPALLLCALTHASHTNETPEDPSYERLEFLGDAVIELMVTRRLYDDYPAWEEGRMTRTRAMVVNEASLSEAAAEIGLGEHIVLGRGTRQLGVQARPSVLCDVFEAVTGAVYLEAGMERAVEVIMPHLEERLAWAAEHGIAGDHKTELQELLQQRGEVKIQYNLADIQGPPHDRRFTIALEVDGREMAKGCGPSKKVAQQDAARMALESLGIERPEPHET